MVYTLEDIEAGVLEADHKKWEQTWGRHLLDEEKRESVLEAIDGKEPEAIDEKEPEGPPPGPTPGCPCADCGNGDSPRNPHSPDWSDD